MINEILIYIKLLHLKSLQIYGNTREFEQTLDKFKSY